jgi:hypothetical protein
VGPWGSRGGPTFGGVSNTLRTSTGDLVIPRVIVTDPAQVALQTIKDTLALWQGSWFQDLNAGFPWLQQVFGVVNPNITAIKGLLRQAILYCPYVIGVTASVFYSHSIRAFAYNFEATLNTGQVITGGSNQPFVVQPQGGTTSQGPN